MKHYPIWLPKEQYSTLQISHVSTEVHAKEGANYAVAEFTRHYNFAKGDISIDITAAAQFFLFVNGNFIGLGPASAGGDFLMTKPLSWMFKNHYTVPCEGPCDIRVLVRLQPDVLTECTPGFGMLFIEGKAGDAEFGTDETWQCRVDRRFVSRTLYNELLEEDTWHNAQQVAYSGRILPAPIPMLRFEDIKGASRVLSANEKTHIDFALIYSAYVRVSVDAPCEIRMDVDESSERSCASLTLRFKNSGCFTTLDMYSVGELTITMLKGSANVTASLVFSHYPAEPKGCCVTADKGLNKVMDVTRWTLKICRQTMHLDSPMHQELLACTGDYYIEMLMTLFESGDMRLADLDIRRTALWLEENNGRMFHTTYSLIWVQMLLKYYMITGNLETVQFCYPALRKLLDLFATYLDENGIVTNAPDYMFVDWTVLEGYSMHHPPRALGQTVLNAFYYKALRDAAQLARFLGESRPDWDTQADRTKAAFIAIFWDEEKQMYIDGLDTCDAGNGRYKVENPRNMRHFSRYPQALAALYGICPQNKAKHLAELAADETNGLPLVQPYFMHFVLEAVIKCGLQEQYAMKLLRKWIPICENCPKGLQEGWLKPQEDYSFDHSHAWGGTPAYHLPLLLTGLEILEPGFKRIHLSPDLYGLAGAEVRLDTPFGELSVAQAQGEEPVIRVPEGIEIIA